MDLAQFFSSAVVQAVAPIQAYREYGCGDPHSDTHGSFQELSILVLAGSAGAAFLTYPKTDIVRAFPGAAQVRKQDQLQYPALVFNVERDLVFCVHHRENASAFQGADLSAGLVSPYGIGSSHKEPFKERNSFRGSIFLNCTMFSIVSPTTPIINRGSFKR